MASFDPRALLDPKSLAKTNGKPKQNKSKSVNGDATTSKASNGWDPRMLLNPKGAGKSNQNNDKSPVPSAELPQATSSDALDQNVLLSAKSPLKREHQDDTPAIKSEAEDSTMSNGQQNTETGMGGLIEKMHNVGKREDEPRKRIKTEPKVDDDEDHEKSSSTFQVANSGGEIGAYIKQKREEGLKEKGPSANIVDLTTGDDDDVVFVSDTGDKQVCIGTLTTVYANAHTVPFPHKDIKSSTMWPHIPVQVSRIPRATRDSSIDLVDPRGVRFGKVDMRTAIALAPIMDGVSTNRMRVVGWLQPRTKRSDQPPGTNVSMILNMHLTLSAPKKMVPSLGRVLSQKQLFLKEPNMPLLKNLFKYDLEVVNPHAPRYLGPAPATPATFGYSNGQRLNASNGYSTRTAEEVARDIQGMFSGLTNHEDLPLKDGPAMLSTELLKHQKQALYFMTDRETVKDVPSDDKDAGGSLWRLKQRSNGTTYYHNVLTGDEWNDRPPLFQGGILADMMGLGKTLSILSLITDTLDAAAEWGNTTAIKSPQDPAVEENAKTTLLIVPVSTVANWEEQIKMHIKDDALKYYIYHGPTRTKTLKHLKSYDIVITTYSVVSTEFNASHRASTLEHIKWFRIVLDEAHTIRETSTKQSRAVCALPAQRRWAVTGTPIQNRLDDLGALVKFLRIEPFADIAGFKRHFLTPLKMGEEGSIDKVRLLVDSITLRRLKDKIDLPPCHAMVEYLDFNDDERALHEAFSKDSREVIQKMMANDSKKGIGAKNYVRVLRCILRMRQVCAHGADLLNDEDLAALEGLNANNAIDLGDEEDIDEAKPVITIKQASDMLSLLRQSDEDRCARCQSKIRSSSPGFDETGSSKEVDLQGYMTPCFQLVCPNCYPQFLQDVEDRRTSDNFMNCPLCSEYVRAIFFPLHTSELLAQEETESRLRSDPNLSKRVNRYLGPSTKSRALLRDLEEARQWSDNHPDEAPLKSVVFSGWTNHLDLIQIALEEAGHTYVRLDGKMHRRARAQALTTFREDRSIRVFLVSIGAGGLGLNLTSASRAYVMEPQFNPAAEAQAVDRVHRLGQKREVTIVRYIMRDSFEEKMRALQEKKMRIADLTLASGERGGKGRVSKGVRVEELKSLFGSSR